MFQHLFCLQSEVHNNYGLFGLLHLLVITGILMYNNIKTARSNITYDRTDF